MSELTIRTNNQPRDTLTWHDLSLSEKMNFDYLDTAEAQDGALFARYRGGVYDLGEFIRAPEEMFGPRKWDGYTSDSWFSGTLVKWANDCQ